MSKSTSKEPEKVEKDAPQEEPVVEETALAEVTETGTDIEAFSDEEDFDSEDSLTFSNGVIEKIVAIAMREVPGVVGMKGSWFNRVQDAFGVVAMVAMTPLITIQIMGAVYKYRFAHARAEEALEASYLDIWADDDIIEL